MTIYKNKEKLFIHTLPIYVLSQIYMYFITLYVITGFQQI